jgi:hypothetical protein
MSKKYKIGNATFGCLQDKQVWILNGVIQKLEYIGHETKLSSCENDLRKRLSINVVFNVN